MYMFTLLALLFSISFFTYAFYQRDVYDKMYNQAKHLIDEKQYLQAIGILDTMRGYRDVDDLLVEIQNEQIYMDAIKYFDNAEYEQAIDLLSQVEGYKDADERMVDTKYCFAIKCYENGDYSNARALFIELDGYSDSNLYLAQIDVQLIEQSQETIYQRAASYYEEKNYTEAIELYKTIINYKDSSELLEECNIQLKRESPNNIVAAGIRNSAAITNLNRVNVVGNNSAGQRDVSDWEGIVSVDIYGTLIIGLQEDGNVRVAGKYDNHEIENLAQWYDIVDVAAGEQFVVGLKRDGTVIADGHPSDGQLEVADWKNIIAIDAGSRFTVGLTEDKQLLFAGFDNGQAEDFENHKDEWREVVNITASGGEKGYRGGGHTVGLKSDGTLVAVGDNTYGQCDFGDTEKWSDIVKVVAGDWYTVGLKSNGTVVITGNNSPNNMYIDEEILATCTNIVDIAAGYGQTLGLTSEGEIIAFGFNEEDKCDGTMGQDWKNLMVPSN